MARPRSFDVDTFLDRSLDVFWQRGFAATSMTDIYEATGLGASSIYAIVKDKNDLFRRVFERYAIGFRTSIPTDVAGATAINRWMTAFASALADDPDRKGCLICNTVMERFAHAPETLAMAQDHFDEVRSWFQQQIEIGQQRGEFRADADPVAGSIALSATTLGMMAMARARTSRDTLLLIAESATDGLITTPPTRAAHAPVFIKP